MHACNYITCSIYSLTYFPDLCSSSSPQSWHQALPARWSIAESAHVAHTRQLQLWKLTGSLRILRHFAQRRGDKSLLSLNIESGWPGIACVRRSEGHTRRSVRSIDPNPYVLRPTTTSLCKRSILVLKLASNAYGSVVYISRRRFISGLAGNANTPVRARGH